MAIFHFDLKPVQRSKGRSMVQLVSYIADLPLKDHRTGKFHRRGSDDDEIRRGRLGPPVAMEELWNMAESAERRKDAVVGRHVIMALPVELAPKEQWDLLWNMAKVIHEETGAPVEIGMHLKRQGRGKVTNPHGHIAFAAREWSKEQGCFTRKTRQLDDRRTGGPIIERWREHWENTVNQALPAGTKKVSRLSHVRAGRDRIPRRHLGERAWRQEQKGYQTRDGQFNQLLDALDTIQGERLAIERGIQQVSSGNFKSAAQVSLERELALAEEVLRENYTVRESPSQMIYKAIEERIAHESQFLTAVPKSADISTGLESDTALILRPRSLEAELSEAEETLTKAVDLGGIEPG